MLVSPTEPDSLRALGTTSSLPERYGVDFLFPSQNVGLAGVQRKEVTDLVRSVRDGRLGKELSQMQQLGTKVLLVEGDWKWTSDGYSLIASSWSRTSLHALELSIQSQGCWLTAVPTLTATCEWLSSFGRWLTKTKHTTAHRRPGPSSPWGSPDNRDWAIHFLSGMDGFGPGLSGDFYDHFDGIPLAWTVGEDELRAVKGIGKERARRLMAMFPASTTGDEPCSDDSRSSSSEADC